MEAEWWNEKKYGGQKGQFYTSAQQLAELLLTCDMVEAEKWAQIHRVV